MTNNRPINSYKDPVFDAVMNEIFGFESFMEKTERLALRKEALEAAKRIEERNNAWLKKHPSTL